MNKIVYDLILKLEKCDDFHNRCDYLLEHSEITELLKYINQLKEELEKKNKIIEEIKEDTKFVRKSVCQELYMSKDERTRKEMNTCHYILTEILQKGDTNE